MTKLEIIREVRKFSKDKICDRFALTIFLLAEWVNKHSIKENFDYMHGWVDSRRSVLEIILDDNEFSYLLPMLIDVDHE